MHRFLWSQSDVETRILQRGNTRHYELLITGDQVITHFNSRIWYLLPILILHTHLDLYTYYRWYSRNSLQNKKARFKQQYKNGNAQEKNKLTSGLGSTGLYTGTQDCTGRSWTWLPQNSRRNRTRF